MRENFKDVKPLKYWIQNVLPQAYDDSLSYQDLLYKVVSLLNQVIENNNNMPQHVSELIQEYISSGAIGEVVQNILSEYMLNVKNPPLGLKGAVGDGSEDDTEAIQGCIDYANANGGKAIYFPSGRYLSKGLTLKDNVAMVGFDRYSTKIVMRGGSLKPLFGGVCNNITINRLTLDGNMDIQTENLNLIDISGGNYLINDVELTDGYDLLKINLSGNLQLENVVFKHGVVNSIVLDGVGKVVGNNLMFNSLSALLGKHIIDNRVDGVVFDNLYSDCSVDVAINNSGDNSSFTGQLVNNMNNITDSGNNTYYNFYGKGGSLQEKIDSEVVARIEADEMLESLINDKMLDRIEAESVLQQNIEAETLARTNDDTLLQQNIEAETLARTNADTTLQENIEAEVLDRTNADDNLSQKIKELVISIKDFGAKGDGITDDTQAFKDALTFASTVCGDVFIPPTINGYLINGDSITIPFGVGLYGSKSGYNDLYKSVNTGSVLLITGNANNIEGNPVFIMRSGSSLKSINFVYPNQTCTNPPISYPFLIKGEGALCNDVSIEDIFVYNCFQFIDFSQPHQRLSIRNISGDVFYRGIVIDHSWDVDRIENIHFWIFYSVDKQSAENNAIMSYKTNNLVAITLGQADSIQGNNIFVYGAYIGLELGIGIESPYGQFTNVSLDICTYGIHTSRVSIGTFTITNLMYAMSKEFELLYQTPNTYALHINHNNGTLIINNMGIGGGPSKAIYYFHNYSANLRQNIYPRLAL